MADQMEKSKITSETKGRAAHSTLESGSRAGDVGSVFLAAVAASAQTFLSLFPVVSSFGAGAALKRDFNLHCYTHQG